MHNLALTPSESYFLLDIENKDGKGMMKYSLINLLYKNVLNSQVREVSEGTIFKKVIKKTYLSKGTRFNSIELKAHEKIFCSAISEKDEIELVEFLKIIFEQYNYDNYYELIEKMQSQSGLINLTEERKFFNIFSKKKKVLTSDGIDTQTKINDILAIGKKNLDNWILNDPHRAKAFMAACGANLLLLDGHDIAILKSYEHKLKDIDKKDYEDYGFIYWLDDSVHASDDVNLEDISNLDAVPNYFNSVSAFDTFDGLDAGFDNASGGDGGGCSGCGGCGGCGGGG